MNLMQFLNEHRWCEDPIGIALFIIYLCMFSGLCLIHFNPFLFLILMHLLLLFYVFEVLYAKLEILLFMTCTV